MLQVVVMSKYIKFCLSLLLVNCPWDAALAQTPTDCGACVSYFWDGGYGHMFFGGFMMPFFWAGLIALIALAVRWVSSGSPGGGHWPVPGKTPRQILEERFARGEIDKEEFEDQKRILGGKRDGYRTRGDAKANQWRSHHARPLPR